MFKWKKKTIFTMFLIPLALIMTMQALIAYWTLWLGGTPRYLEDYSVSIMGQIVRNRNLILENNMVHRWSDIEGECQTANFHLTQILEEKGLTEEEFLSDEEAKRELLQTMLVPGITALRRNGVNGFYIVLADGFQEAVAEQEEEGAGNYSGFYFRDFDASSNPRDYSDLLMERGDFNFSHELKVPFDTMWTTKFSLSEKGERPDDDFFYKPYRAALDNPGAEAAKLAYWSKTFCLEGEMENDSYRMIAYSRPLISDRGTVYGVMGVDISLSALKDLLPEQELNEGNQSGYILAERQNDGSFLPFYTQGPTVGRNVPLGEPLSLEETKYDSLYKIDGIRENHKAFYASLVPLSMYNSNTPFAENHWALLGVQDQDGLFGMGKRIMRNMGLVILFALAFGLICICIVMNHLTRPISELADWIRGVRKNSVKEHDATEIAEIDDLYDAVYNLTERQKQAEYAVIEEKERYRLALQSSSDIIFTYNIAEDSMEIFNLNTQENDGAGEKKVPHVLDHVRRNKLIHDMDRQFLEKMLVRLDAQIKVHFRFRTKGQDWQWMELSGKTIRDESGKKIKMIGSIRNIHEQKMQEQMDSKAARRDPVTGLYREEIGQKLISTEVEMGREGYLALMDLDKFKEMNDQYGIEFGDAVLEELGGYVLKLKRRTERSGKRIVAVRAGGDEILLWMRGFKQADVVGFFDEFYRMPGQLFQDGGFELSITSAGLAVAAKNEGFKELTGKLFLAMYCCKKRRSGMFTFYEDIPKEELSGENGEKRSYNEIASMGNARELSMVTKAFNLFERGGQVAPILSIMFAKMGERYKASDIVMTEIRWDFNASVVSGQWHLTEGTVPDKSVAHFTEQELRSCAERLSAGGVHFEADSGFTQTERRILHIPAGAAGYCVPIYDNGRQSGAVTFVRRPGRRRMNEAECGELQEIVKIIETNVNRERYDLASRAKSDFLSRMSHEIRTPMNAIIGMTSIALQKKEEPDRMEDCLHKIDQSSQYLLSLINDILDMSKIESGKMKLAPETGSLVELVREISDLMRPQVEEKKITYVQDVRVDDEWVSADFMRLKQVIINLMGNAVKFTPENGTIIFSVKTGETPENGADRTGVSGETEVYFAVADNGIGISDDNRERIFNAFEQAENSTAVAYGGTGLGLSISSRLVRMMGGDISLESEEGKGSRFSFVLRLKQAEQQARETDAADDWEQRDFTGYRVLLVEDNELNTEIARTLLEMHGFTVETAGNGQEGVDRFANSGLYYYDLILMDIRMPVMDGLEAAETIRRMNRADAVSVPIIAMTANAFDDDMRKSIESGMNGHLAKPVDVSEMLRVASAVIRKK